MSRWPAMICAMCGGSPPRMASVMNSLLVSALVVCEWVGVAISAGAIGAPRRLRGRPSRLKAAFASLRDGLRPALTPEPMLPLSGTDEGRPGACPRHTRSAPIATRKLSRDKSSEIMGRESQWLTGGWVGQAGAEQCGGENVANDVRADPAALRAESALEQQRRRWQPYTFLPVVGGDQWDRAGVVADPVDDRAEHIRQFRRDQQESLLVGLRWDDLQQRHDFVGGGQTVLHKAVVRELQQLLNPDAGGPQDFHDRPGPEGVVFFEFEVASLAGAGVVRPDLAGEGSVAGGGADQRLPGCGEPLSRLGVAGCPQDRVGCFALLIDGAHQRRQNG